MISMGVGHDDPLDIAERIAKGIEGGRKCGKTRLWSHTGIYQGEGLTLDQIDLHVALRPFERELNQVKLGSIGNRLTDQRS